MCHILFMYNHRYVFVEESFLGFFQDIKFRKIIKRLAKNPELVAAAKDPSMVGNPKWRRIVDKQLTDEEKAFIKKNFYDRGKIRTGLGGPSFKK